MKPIGYIYQSDGAAPDQWAYSHGERPIFDQGAFWIIKPVYDRAPREHSIPISGGDPDGLKDSIQTYCTTCDRLLSDEATP
jgi:hypothetical protein